MTTRHSRQSKKASGFCSNKAFFFSSSASSLCFASPITSSLFSFCRKFGHSFRRKLVCLLAGIYHLFRGAIARRTPSIHAVFVFHSGVGSSFQSSPSSLLLRSSYSIFDNHATWIFIMQTGLTSNVCGTAQSRPPGLCAPFHRQTWQWPLGWS